MKKELLIGTGLMVLVWAFACVCAWTLAKGAI